MKGAKAKTGTSPAGSAPAGWTLVELLVVLLILGAVASLAMPTLRAALPSLRLASQVREIVAALRQCQRQSIESGQETEAVVDLTAKTITSCDGISLRIDPRAAIELTSVTTEARGANAGRMRFFPDGTSTGGRIRLTYGSRHYDVTVDWIMGRAVLASD